MQSDTVPRFRSVGRNVLKKLHPGPTKRGTKNGVKRSLGLVEARVTHGSDQPGTRRGEAATLAAATSKHFATGYFQVYYEGAARIRRCNSGYRLALLQRSSFSWFGMFT